MLLNMCYPAVEENHKKVCHEITNKINYGQSTIYTVLLWRDMFWLTWSPYVCACVHKPFGIVHVHIYIQYIVVYIYQILHMIYIINDYLC